MASRSPWSFLRSTAGVPSRCALTTGQYPQRWKITSFLNNRADNSRRGVANWLDPKAPTLARTLQQSGYATGHFGKWHMGGQRDVDDDAPAISEYGFDESLTNFEGMGAKLLPLTMKPGATEPGKIWADAERLGKPVTWMQRSQITGGYIDAAIPFIEATSMMALAQTAMLCRAAVDQSQRDAAEIQIHDAWPQSEGQTGVLKALKRLRHGLSLASRQCNWLGWLHVDALTAFQVANDLRNRLRHDLKPRDHYTDLQALRAPLQCAMDVAGYWAMHPLCFEVRAAPGGGWQAQCFWMQQS